MAEPKLTQIAGIGPATARLLEKNGFASVESVAKASDSGLAKVPGFGMARAAVVIVAAQSLLATPAMQEPGGDKKNTGKGKAGKKKKHKKDKGKKKDKDKKKKKKKDKKGKKKRKK
jgi:hypothetical protein